ncbi:MAG: amidophosphoribosyltransferase, partial [Candidatus Nanoarchaeia archaeon]|nr:amidophosphoribosyltransferase [Candidatus Jingweiarchaeum tengchongense]
MERGEACGVVGAAGEVNVRDRIYYGLIALQHRGHESVGFSFLDQDKIVLEKATGLVTTFPKASLLKLKGRMGIGHVRYSTIGNSTIEDAQPFMVESPRNGIALAHNGNVVNYFDLKIEAMRNGRQVNSMCDAEVILNTFVNELSKKKDIECAIENCMKKIEGAYSVVMFTGQEELISFRDPFGFKPLCYGRNEGLEMVASESVALDINNVKNFSDIQPGEMLIVNNENTERKRIIKNKSHAHCMFEYVYFSRPDSVIDGKCVYDVRRKLGENLTKNYKSDADIIVPVPDTSRPAADEISRRTGIPVMEGLIKNRYIGRTFIMPEQDMREKAVFLKLNPLRPVIKNKHVLLVDDSIVRGTTSKKIIELVRSAGAKKVDFWVTCPPIISPCFYGIDIATHNELIAFKNPMNEIERKIGADNLCYQTIDGLVDAIGFHKNDLCLACLTGSYPTPLAQKIADEMKEKNFTGRRY